MFQAVTSAPRSISMRVTSARPIRDERCNGVSPSPHWGEDAGEDVGTMRVPGRPGVARTRQHGRVAEKSTDAGGEDGSEKDEGRAGYMRATMRKYIYKKGWNS